MKPRSRKPTGRQSSASSAFTLIELLVVIGPTVIGAPRRSGETATYESRMAEYEQFVFEDTLKKHKGDRRAACQELGISRATFYRKLGQLRNYAR
jgi:DNA-binding NtrC family response regulator